LLHDKNSTTGAQQSHFAYTMIP